MRQCRATFDASLGCFCALVRCFVVSLLRCSVVCSFGTCPEADPTIRAICNKAICIRSFAHSFIRSFGELPMRAPGGIGHCATASRGFVKNFTNSWQNNFVKNFTIPWQTDFVKNFTISWQGIWKLSQDKVKKFTMSWQKLIFDLWLASLFFVFWKIKRRWEKERKKKKRCKKKEKSAKSKIFKDLTFWKFDLYW